MASRGTRPTLVMRLEGLTFPEAVAYLTGGPAPSGKSATRPATRPAPKPPPEPSGLPEADALALVEAAAARLWTPEGADALAYLTGPDRCLTPETIRAARLGVDAVGADPRGGRDDVPGPRGGHPVVRLGTAWRWSRSANRDGRRPKYVEAFRDPARLVCYPGPETIRPGRPLVVVEGEFDALCLGEALGDLAAVVTLGSASARPEPAALGVMLAAPRWFIATDADPAGDKAADGWPARPGASGRPGPFKDWTEATAGGVDLARWWRDILTGIDRPPLFSWDELSRWRWGRARHRRPRPGIVGHHRPGGWQAMRRHDPKRPRSTAPESAGQAAAQADAGQRFSGVPRIPLDRSERRLGARRRITSALSGPARVRANGAMRPSPSIRRSPER